MGYLPSSVLLLQIHAEFSHRCLRINSLSWNLNLESVLFFHNFDFDPWWMETFVEMFGCRDHSKAAVSGSNMTIVNEMSPDVFSHDDATIL